MTDAEFEKLLAQAHDSDEVKELAKRVDALEARLFPDQATGDPLFDANLLGIEVLG